MAGYIPVRLSYKVVNPVGLVDENLPPIIFLHGATYSKEQWGDIPQVVASGTKRKAYVLDARNHGDSEWSDEFNFEILVDDLLHFMDSHNLSKVILIGHSMGGTTACKAALLRPDLVEGIIVEDMLVRKVPQPILEHVVSYIKSLRESVDGVPPNFDENEAKIYIAKNLITDVSKNVNFEEDNPFFDLKCDEFGRWAFKTNLEVLQRTFSNPDTLMKEPQGKYTGPACFMFGTLSPMLVDKDEFHIIKFFPQAQFVPFEDAPHDVHETMPLQFAEACIKYVLELSQ